MVFERRANAFIARIAILVLAALSIVLAVPGKALARSYSIDQVDIDATISEDGTLWVAEEREFDFDGEFNGVYWKIPQGYYVHAYLSPDVSAAGVVENGRFEAYEESYSGANGSYELRDRGDSIEVKIYSHQEDARVRFRIEYSVANAVVKFADVSELYWKYVSDGWDEKSRNVTMTLHLPVPQGESVRPEDNVRAWGHGPLDGKVSFEGNDIVFFSPGVGTSEFAEARVTFPVEWMPDYPQHFSDAALPEILNEEQGFADAANRRREEARILQLVSGIAGGGVALLAAAGTVFARFRYKRKFRAQFDDTYFRDVPSADHPAVLDALMNGGKPGGSGFTATLMRLTDQHRLALDKVKLKRTGFMGRERIEDDYRVTVRGTLPRPKDFNDPIERDATKIDKAALEFLIYNATKSNVASAPNDTVPPLYFSEMESVAEEHPSGFASRYDDWSDAASEACERRFKNRQDGTGTGMGPLIAVFVVCVIAAIAMLVFGLSVEIGWYIILPVILALAGAAAFALVTALGFDNINQEGLEVKAKLEALKRWLKDFTRLKEAVPDDVVLWNRLLVMAVVLGVSKEVIDQLKVSMPHILEDDSIAPVYSWYHYSSAGRSPADNLRSAVDSAHHVSTAALAESSSSSGGGGGGGFSGGGGGGFGGGGGGGAF